MPGGSLSVDFLHPPTASGGVVGSAGTEWDHLTVTNTLSLTALNSSSKFTLKLTRSSGIDNSTFEDPTLINGYGQWRWSNVVSFGTLAGSFAASDFNIQASGFSGSLFSLGGSGTPTGTFSLEQVGNGFDLIYTIPEPATVALLAGLGALGLAALRRRMAAKGRGNRRA
jgi:hypothetical protein